MPFCVEFLTGKEKWKKRGAGGSMSVISAEGLLYMHYANGTMVLAKASSDDYEVISSFKIPHTGDRPDWSHPIIADGKLFIRSEDSIRCYRHQGQAGWALRGFGRNEVGQATKPDLHLILSIRSKGLSSGLEAPRVLATAATKSKEPRVVPRSPERGTHPYPLPAHKCRFSESVFDGFRFGFCILEGIADISRG